MFFPASQKTMPLTTVPELDGRRLRYVERNISRHGTARFYFRRAGTGRVRLPDPGEDPSLFLKVYQRCLKDSGALTPRIAGKRKKKRNNPLYRAIWEARHRARRKGRSFDLTPGWLLSKMASQDNRCAVTGIPMIIQSEDDRDSPYRMSIDRIDSSQGYTQTNCRLVILALNLAVNRWGLDEYLKIAQAAISGTVCHTENDECGSAVPHPPESSVISNS